MILQTGLTLFRKVLVNFRPDILPTHQYIDIFRPYRYSMWGLDPCTFFSQPQDLIDPLVKSAIRSIVVGYFGTKGGDGYLLQPSHGSVAYSAQSE